MWQSFCIQHMCENMMAQAVCANGEVKAKGLLYTVRSVWKIVLWYNKWLNTLSYELSWIVIWPNAACEWAKVTHQTFICVLRCCCWFRKLIPRSSSICPPLEGAPRQHYSSVRFGVSDCCSVCLQSHIRERFSLAFLCLCVTHLLSGWRSLCGHRLRTLEVRCVFWSDSWLVTLTVKKTISK